MQDLKTRVAERIKERRLKISVTQETLGKFAGVDRKTINRIENGHFRHRWTHSLDCASLLTLSRKLF